MAADGEDIQVMSSIVRDSSGRNYLVPFILVTSLFFLWGFAHGILDVLNKHFQDVLVISKARSGLVQATVYGGYFLMALPAGRIIRRWGYRTGIVLGLVLYGIGALMFVPGARLMSFPFFLLCLFVIGCGLTCLETSANPYATVLGDRESAVRRLNLAQSFNGLGWIAGPLAGGLIILGEDSDISLPYAVIGCVVLVLGLVFSRLRLPSVDTSDASPEDEPGNTDRKSIWKVRTFRYGVPALFFYVAAQTGINSFFINYVTEADSGDCRGRKAFRDCAVRDISVRERHVPDNIFHGPCGYTRRGHQDCFVISYNVYRRRGCIPCADGPSR